MPQDLDLLNTRVDRFSEVAERKRAVLRALKDLEHERAIGKIDSEDYNAIAAHYRGQAKTILRELDAEVAPYRARAEELAERHLARRGLTDGAVPFVKAAFRGKTASAVEGDAAHPSPAAEAEANVTDGANPAPSRIACPKCATSNEPDAAFCKKCGTALQEVSHAEA